MTSEVGRSRAGPDGFNGTGDYTSRMWGIMFVKPCAESANPRRRNWYPLKVLVLLACIVLPTLATAQESGHEPASGDAKDTGEDSKFVFVPYPISDPAIGVGLLAGPVWMRDGPRNEPGPSKPQAFGVGALWTDGGSRGLVAFDHRAWRGGIWRTTALIGTADVHIDFLGHTFGKDKSHGFTISADGGSISAERRLGDGPNSLNFRLFSAEATLDFDTNPPIELATDLGAATISGLALGWARDTRDEVFAPSSGHAGSAVLTSYSEFMGSSFDAQALKLIWTGYRDMGKAVIGLRTKMDLSFGDPPFYLRPYIAFRGVPALSYAGERVATIEAEYRQSIKPNWDVLLFAGAGSARTDYRGINVDSSVTAAGVGFRFKATKLFGLTLGLDFAEGPDGSASYIQIGNAWTN